MILRGGETTSAMLGLVKSLKFRTFSGGFFNWRDGFKPSANPKW